MLVEFKKRAAYEKTDDFKALFELYKHILSKKLDWNVKYSDSWLKQLPVRKIAEKLHIIDRKNLFDHRDKLYVLWILLEELGYSQNKIYPAGHKTINGRLYPIYDIPPLVDATSNVAEPSENVAEPEENVIEPEENVIEPAENVIEPATNVTDSTKIEIIRTPDIIAAEILQLKESTCKIVINYAIEIGRRLCEAKSMLATGLWSSWLTDTVDYSQRTAENLMRIYKEYGDAQGQLFGGGSKSQALANLNYTQAVALLQIPAEEREEFAASVNAAKLSSRELAEAIKQKQKAESDAEGLRYANEILNQEHQELQNRLTKLQDEYFELKESGKATGARLEEANEKIKNLQGELKGNAVTIAKNEEKIQELASEQSPDLERTVKYKIHFNNFVREFTAALDSIAMMESQKSHDEGLRNLKQFLETELHNLKEGAEND